MKHEIKTRVEYCGEFKKSGGYGYIVTAVYKGDQTGTYYHDIKAIEKPKLDDTVLDFDKRGVDYYTHADELHGVKFDELVKV